MASAHPHPIVVMAYDKDPAIGKAVSDLEEAGFDVVVLNTQKAKLVDFLGALAGEVQDDDNSRDENKKTATKDDDSEVEKTPAADDAEADADADRDEVAEDMGEFPGTAIVEGEEVKLVVIPQGEPSVLFTSDITIGARTSYSLNESQFSFWPSSVSDEPVKGGVEVKIDDFTHRGPVIFSEQTKNPPELHLSIDFLKEGRMPKDSSPMLPATKAVFGKNKVTAAEVIEQWPNSKAVMVVQRKNERSYPEKDQGIAFVPSTGYKEGEAFNVHHDQSFGYIGKFTVLGYITKDGDKMKYEGKKVDTMGDGVEKFKAPVFVFK